MNFDVITGQKAVTANLSGLIKRDMVGHAYIFTGPKGIGKRTVARIFAALLLCAEQNADASCGKCKPCRMFSSGTNPDFYVIKADSASIGVDEIRNMQSDIVVRPLYSPRKVYLIEEADKMTAQAQNCLLKTLEEPPLYAVIILTAANYDALLETVRSRSIRYNFSKNTTEEVLGYLKARFGSKLKNADFLASYADGIIGTALELADSEEFVALREKTIEVALKLIHSKLLDVFELYGFFEANKADIDSILNILLLFYRDLLVAKSAGKESVLINSDKKDIILSNACDLTMRKLVENIEVIETTGRNIKQNVNYQLSIEVMLMKLREDD